MKTIGQGGAINKANYSLFNSKLEQRMYHKTASEAAADFLKISQVFLFLAKSLRGTLH
jgi:hypothetical protein